MPPPRSPPEVCPDCGAEDAYEARYTTGGWRIDHFRCVARARRFDPRQSGEGG